MPVTANPFPKYLSGYLLIFIKDFTPRYIANAPKIRLISGIQKNSPNMNDAMAVPLDFSISDENLEIY